MNKYTLGLCTMGNSSAALIKDGKLIAAVEEERLSRVKNDSSFPHKSIKEVLDIGQVNINSIDTIAIYWRPWNIWSRAWFSSKEIITSSSTRQYIFNRIKKLSKPSESLNEGSWYDLFKIRQLLKEYHGLNHSKIKYYDHHITHQKYGEVMHDCAEYITLSYDGGGESYSSVLSVVKDGCRKILSKHRWPNSLGHFYSTFTGFLGFKMLEGEYKMMGLAPYGKPIWKDLILKEILNLKANGKYVLNKKICNYHAALHGDFNPILAKLFCKKREKNEIPTVEHINLASSVQAAFEEAQLHILKPAIEKYPEIKCLVLTGGCALNVTANGKILDTKYFDKVFIPPAPHDAGCSIGAALCNYDYFDPDSIRDPYQGRSYSNIEIAKELIRLTGIDPEKFIKSDENIVNITADFLEQGHLVAWFQGRSEFGPRALGCRSFLADPRNDDIREQINLKIKKRELFRPFAPSTIDLNNFKIFDLSQPSPYMNIVATVLKNEVPAVTHIDKSARVHTVNKNMNKLYYKLIKRFGELTGVPVLLNTSFNIQEPIVYSPHDAITTFLSSDVDALVIGNYFIKKEDLKCT